MYVIKNFLIISSILISAVLLTVVYKNDERIEDKVGGTSFQIKELNVIKEFLLRKINSPFINVDYEIKNGDSIQKILKKFKVQNKVIERVINLYKKYGDPNQLLVGNKIDIVVEKKLSNNNTVAKFSVPKTKSTTIEIS